MFPQMVMLHDALHPPLAFQKDRPVSDVPVLSPADFKLATAFCAASRHGQREETQRRSARRSCCDARSGFIDLPQVEGLQIERVWILLRSFTSFYIYLTIQLNKNHSKGIQWSSEIRSEWTCPRTLCTPFLANRHS